MLRSPFVAALWTLLLIFPLVCLAPAAAEDAPEGAGEPPAEAVGAGDEVPEAVEDPGPREGEFRVRRLRPGEVVVVESDDLEALGEALDPWESDGIVVHGAAGADEQIQARGIGRDDADIEIHTGTSGDAAGIPTIRMGTSSDADIVVHGSGGREPSRIKVHGHGR